MEVCTPRFLSNTPHHHRSFIPTPLFHRSRAALSPKKNLTPLKKSGLIYFASPLPRASASEETSTSISKHFEEAPDEAINTKTLFTRAPDEAMTTDTQLEKALDEAINAEVLIEKAPAESISADPQFDKGLDEALNTEAQFEKAPDEAINAGALFEEVSDEVKTTEEASTAMEATPVAVQTQAIELLDRLNIKLDFGNSYSIFLYESGALAALRILSAIVGAIDSIPLFPKMLEIIGLSYIVWFSYRYLIFKKNRDDLSVKIEELKKQIIGSTND